MAIVKIEVCPMQGTSHTLGGTPRAYESRCCANKSRNSRLRNNHKGVQEEDNKLQKVPTKMFGCLQ